LFKVGDEEHIVSVDRIQETDDEDDAMEGDVDEFDETSTDTSKSED
jgi:hypothetical protein